jgi:hypothetical protein
MVIVEESGAMGQVVHQKSGRRIQFMEEVWKDQGRRDRFCPTTGLEAYPILSQLHQKKRGITKGSI